MNATFRWMSCTSRSLIKRNFLITNSVLLDGCYRQLLVKRTLSLSQSVIKSCRESTKTSPENLSATAVKGWGSNITGALGSYIVAEQSDESAITKPLNLHIPSECVNLGGGNGFSAFIVTTPEHYSVYGCGINTHGQLGQKDEDFITTPSLIDGKIGTALQSITNGNRTRVVSVSCGRAHTWIATSNKQVFSIGTNIQGQCGRPLNDTTPMSMAPKVEFDKQIKQISCGMDHTLVLTESGQVYSCGLGADGQTGLGRYKAVDQLTRVCGDIEEEKIVFVASRADCSLAVSDKGEVFGWGNSEYGQLETSVGDEKQVNVPRHLPVLQNRKLVSAAAAGTMCALLDDLGDVYVWGYGILGLRREVQQFSTPQLLPRTCFSSDGDSHTSPVTQIHCGINHFAALSESGELYMWGKQKHHCLGTNNPRDQFTPHKVDVMNVHKVSCGFHHTLALCLLDQ